MRFYKVVLLKILTMINNEDYFRKFIKKIFNIIYKIPLEFEIIRTEYINHTNWLTVFELSQKN